MRCKRHPKWSGPGVCAACLRERLLALVAAKEAAAGPMSWSSSPSVAAAAGCGGGHPLPLPSKFPRSVSPYTGRRSTEGRLFYSTPQVGPRSGRSGGRAGQVSAWSAIFRSRSSAGADPPASTSSSWFSNLLGGKRREKKSRLFSLEEDAPENGAGYSGAGPRGMSPARKGRAERPEESPAASGYSWKSAGTPQRRRAAAASSGSGAAGLTFCLTPLVRAIPAGDAAGFSCEIRQAGSHRLSSAGSLDGSRSRKLANFGKFREGKLGTIA